MLLKKDLLDGVDEKYIPMLSEVNICDFTKCIAQFSGLQIQYIPDKVIKDYLLIWAGNKYYFYKMLGNHLRKDTKIEYRTTQSDYADEFETLARKYPAYIPWLDGFNELCQNKIESVYNIKYETKMYIKEYFPSYRIEGSSLTHFFKSCLKAPDEVVTAIGRIFENQTISATHTISIDPIDMMLASENPYNWTSCYKLALDNECSHADGCLAAVLDSSSLITYIWNHEGKFSLYDNYEFKNIRYKRMREWISISPSMTCIHFNDIYPGKSYQEDFYKQLRGVVEETVATYRELPNQWEKDWQCCCEREFFYGYGEYSDDRIWKMKGYPYECWKVFDEEIDCPCGCGDMLPESDWQHEEEYNGCGFTAENYEEEECYDNDDEYYDEDEDEEEYDPDEEIE